MPLTETDCSLEEVVQHFCLTAPPTKRKMVLGILEGPDIKRRREKPEERESERSSGERSSSN